MANPNEPYSHEASGRPIHVLCPHCQASLELPHTQAGEKTACPRCGGQFIVPVPTARGVRGESDSYESSEVRSFASKKIAAGVCAIMLGGLGIHKFVLGLTTPGVIMLLITVLTCGIGGAVMGLVGLIEGVIYLTKSDEDFYETYCVEQKGWF